VSGPSPVLARLALGRAVRAAAFAGYFTLLFLRANAAVVWEIVTPRSRLAPAVVWLPLRSRTAQEITTLAYLINLTPGTLVLEASEVPPVLLIHGMHAGDPAAFLATLAHLEDRMLGVARRPGGDAR
jgi:multicomponent Na+:H+ antiporter subunit E